MISPENGFALYFLGYLYFKIHKKIPQDIISRLSLQLERSEYWKDRLQTFGLCIQDLKHMQFNNENIPRVFMITFILKENISEYCVKKINLCFQK